MLCKTPSLDPVLSKEDDKARKAISKRKVSEEDEIVLLERERHISGSQSEREGKEVLDNKDSNSDGAGSSSTTMVTNNTRPSFRPDSNDTRSISNFSDVNTAIQSDIRPRLDGTGPSVDNIRPSASDSKSHIDDIVLGVKDVDLDMVQMEEEGGNYGDDRVMEDDRFYSATNISGLLSETTATQTHSLPKDIEVS